MKQLPRINVSVLLQVGDDRVMGTLRRIEVQRERVTYHVVAQYKGWMVLAQIGDLLQRDDEATYYTAHDVIDIQLIPPSLADESEKEALDDGR